MTKYIFLSSLFSLAAMANCLELTRPLEVITKRLENKGLENCESLTPSEELSTLPKFQEAFKSYRCLNLITIETKISALESELEVLRGLDHLAKIIQEEKGKMNQEDLENPQEIAKQLKKDLAFAFLAYQRANDVELDESYDDLLKEIGGEYSSTLRSLDEQFQGDSDLKSSASNLLNFTNDEGESTWKSFFQQFKELNLLAGGNLSKEQLNFLKNLELNRDDLNILRLEGMDKRLAEIKFEAQKKYNTDLFKMVQHRNHLLVQEKLNSFLNPNTGEGQSVNLPLTCQDFQKLNECITDAAKNQNLNDQSNAKLFDDLRAVAQSNDEISRVVNFCLSKRLHDVNPSDCQSTLLASTQDKLAELDALKNLHSKAVKENLEDFQFRSYAIEELKRCSPQGLGSESYGTCSRFSDETLSEVLKFTQEGVEILATQYYEDPPEITCRQADSDEFRKVICKYKNNKSDTSGVPPKQVEDTPAPAQNLNPEPRSNRGAMKDAITSALNDITNTYFQGLNNLNFYNPYASNNYLPQTSAYSCPATSFATVAIYCSTQGSFGTYASYGPSNLFSSYTNNGVFSANIDFNNRYNLSGLSSSTQPGSILGQFGSFISETSSFNFGGN